MQQTLIDFCNRYRVQLAEEPQLILPSSQTCLIKDTSGEQWVVKSKSPDDKSCEILKSFSFLHPPFHYPQPASDPAEPYLLYPYIQGESFAGKLFERPEIIEQVMEVIGRLQALMRSLILVPYYREALRPKEPAENSGGDLSDRFNFAWVQAMDSQSKVARRNEIAESYRWTKEKVDTYCDLIEADRLWSQAPLTEYRDYFDQNFSIHVPIVGNNLSHTAMHPEHLVLCPDKQIGVLGWHIEPRPRFYMTYTYLAWSFLRSTLPDAKDFYREYLIRNSAKAFFKEHNQVFAFCLLEQLAQVHEQKALIDFEPFTQRLTEAKELFGECVDNLAKKEKPIIG